MTNYKIFKPSPPPQRGVIPLYLIVQKTKNKIEAGGLITTDDAWQVLRMDYSYVTIATYFKVLMEQLVDKNLAIRVRQGQYELADFILVDDKLLAESYLDQKNRPRPPVKLIDFSELPPITGGMTKFSVQDDGIRRVGPFYSKVYNQIINT